MELQFLIKLLWRSRLKFQNMYVGDYSLKSAYIFWSSLNYIYVSPVYSGYFNSSLAIYTYRAGHKLEAAIEQLEIDVSGKVALDSGLSTGGFTDCLLQYGASFVYGVDVGYGQVRLHKWIS